MERLAVIGGGAMGGALLGGLLVAGTFAPEAVVVVEPDKGRAGELARAHGVSVTADPGARVAGADVVVLAVKPQAVAAACEQLRAGLEGDPLIVSIVAGVPTAAIEDMLPLARGRRVVRAMPNSAALVRRGVSAVAPGAHADGADLDAAETLLAAVGEVVRVPEVHMDAVTALSGSGPAYFFLVAEALTDAGTALGLSRDVAAILVHQTMAGAAALLQETGRTPAELRAQVTSPAGTTAAALGVLERRAVRAAFADAAVAAAERSVQLGTAPPSPA